MCCVMKAKPMPVSCRMRAVPFLVEDELKAKGGIFSKAGDWQPYVLTDGLLITGQNPASSGPGAKALVEGMNRMAN
jgi:putative intracellular protease/amidase